MSDRNPQQRFTAPGTFRAFALQSGSNGNCIYVQAGDAHLLFDAGISGIEAQRRFATHQLTVPSHGALFISHDHSDHTRCAGVFHRKFGFDLYMTQPTWFALNSRNRLGRVRHVHFFDSGDDIAIADIRVETVPTPHDGVDGVAFVVEYRQKRLGIFTDLGHPFDGLEEILCTLDGVFLESNYDPHMLMTGPYPYPLKKRISDPSGHISNEESATLLRAAFNKRLKWAVLAHLSGENNTAELALSTHQRIVGKDKPLFVARRNEVSDIFTL
ncbi:MAG: MBL fold metallo-hydrolase [Deltaproteobacteria bacterium]|nr:MBL fold metallo-hydrolase [Deltaproteobacteria bacterium]